MKICSRRDSCGEIEGEESKNTAYFPSPSKYRDVTRETRVVIHAIQLVNQTYQPLMKLSQLPKTFSLRWTSFAKDRCAVLACNARNWSTGSEIDSLELPSPPVFWCRLNELDETLSAKRILFSSKRKLADGERRWASDSCERVCTGGESVVEGRRCVVGSKLEKINDWGRKFQGCVSRA